jgi:hypothetical protein
MSTAARLGLFALGLAAIFLAAVGIGSLVEPADTESGGHGEKHGERSEMKMNADGPHGGHGPHDGDGAATAAGLAISEGGYTLRLERDFIERDEKRELRFAIAGPDGEPVTDFDELHERRLHLILVRRDGSDFRHLHPEMDAAGNWSEVVSLPTAGVYKVFADFSTGGEQHTLGGDLFVAGGEFEARPFPAPAPLATAGGYEVRLRAAGAAAGEPTSLRFEVRRDGEPVPDLAPYLGAKGHLVALREGDLAFLHVHPEEGEGAESGEHPHGDEHAEAAAPGEIAFAATFPTAGHYRLYLQFRHDGAVHTAGFTVAVPR